MLISQTIQPRHTLLVLALGVVLSACGKSSNEQNPAAGGMPAMPVTVQAVAAETDSPICGRHSHHRCRRTPSNTR